MPTTAANWWLFRVAARLRALKAPNSRSRKARAARRPDSRGAAGSAFFLPFAAFPAFLGSGSSAMDAPDRRSASATQPLQIKGIRKLEGTQGHRRQVELEGQAVEADLLDEGRQRLQLADRFLKIGLLIVPASWIG